MQDENGIRLETTSAENRVLTYPQGASTLPNADAVHTPDGTVFDIWAGKADEKEIPVTVKQTAYSKFEISFPDNFMDGLKDALIQIDYRGDIGCAFINGDMISDNFCNNNTWEIGLRTFADRLKDTPLTLSISPLREGVNVNVESAMAARMENADKYIAELLNVKVCPVYEVKIQ